MKKLMTRYMAKLLFPALAIPVFTELDSEEWQMLITWLQLGCSFWENPFGFSSGDGFPLNFLDALHRARTVPTCNWQEVLLQEYLETQPGAPPEYVCQLMDWIHGGHSIYSNPWGIYEEDGMPMNYLDALAFLEEAAWQAATADNCPCDFCNSCNRECRYAGCSFSAGGSTDDPELPF